MNILKSCSFKTPIIVVGNLSLGGTGKSPHTMYLAKLLKDYSPIILSRGYGRKTNGFLWVDKNKRSLEVGDEPVMFFNSLENTKVAVCENRCLGISTILNDKPDSKVVLLDDAFQHRALKPGMSILLFEYSSLTADFYLLPAGRRRDVFSRWKAADIIVITKSPENYDAKVFELRFSGKPVFFSRYVYQGLLTSNEELIELNAINQYNLLLLTGIAEPEALFDKLSDSSQSVTHLKFSDHQNFREKEVEIIRKNMVKFADSDSLLVTTAKDFVRLKDVLSEQEIKSWLIVQIEIQLDNKEIFNKKIKTYVERAQGNSSIH